MPKDDIPVWRPPLSATEGLAQEAHATTVTSIPVDSASKSAGAVVPESTEDHQETGGGIPSESPPLTFMDTEIPTELEEEAVDDIPGNTLEVADAVTHKHFGGNVGADKTVPDTTEKETVQTIEQDDKRDEIIPEDVDLTESEVPQVTPQGEEPPSEAVAQEVLTEATVAVLTTPMILPTLETVTVEAFGREVSAEPGPEVPSEVLAEGIPETTAEVTLGLEVKDILDNSLDVNKKVILTDEILETPTEDSPELITETLPEAPDLVEAEEPEGDTQKPPVEHLPDGVLEVSHDETKVSTEATQSVFFITNTEEDKIFIDVTPDRERVLDTETELPSHASIMTTTDTIEIDVSEHIEKDKEPEDKPTLSTEVTSEPLIVILHDEVTPKSTDGEAEQTEKLFTEETVKEENAVETIGESEDKVREVTAAPEDKATEAAVEVVTIETGEVTEATDDETAKEEVKVQTEDVTSVQELLVETAEEKTPVRAEGTTIAVEDTVETLADVTAEEEPVGPLQTFDEITKETEEGKSKALKEPAEGREVPHVPVKTVEEGKGVIETSVEEPAVETAQEPEPVEKTEEIAEPSENDDGAKDAELGQEVETGTVPVKDIIKQTKPTQDVELVEGIVKETKPTEEPAQDVEHRDPTEEPESVESGPVQEAEPEVVPEEDKINLDVTSEKNSQETAEAEQDSEETTPEFHGEMTEEEPGAEGTKPEVTEDIVETFDGTPSESDEEITPIVVAVPEDTEGLLPGTEIEPTPELTSRLPEDSDLKLYSDTTKESTTQVVHPAGEVTETAHFSDVERKINPEIPTETAEDTQESPEEFSPEIAPEKDSASSEDSTQFTPAKVVPEVAPEEDGPRGEDSAQFVPTEVPVEVEHIPHDVALDNAGEILESPTEVSSEEITPEVTAETTQGATIEEISPDTSVEVTTKYIVEYNNGNFPDLTEKPYDVDDNLLGNNGFGLDEEEENVVRK